MAIVTLLAHAIFCQNSYKGTHGAKLIGRYFLITMLAIIAEVIVTIWTK
jgi:hypothetical protein